MLQWGECQIKGHRKCGSVHGHSYKLEVYLEGELEGSMLVNFNDIKEYIRKFWDHKLIVPLEDVKIWRKAYEKLGMEDNIVGVKEPTAEIIAETILSDLERLLPNINIRVVLYETPGNSVEVTGWRKIF